MRFLLLLLVAAHVACNHGEASAPHMPAPATAPAGNLVFRDPTGRVVATADLQWPATPPADGASFQGSWQLLTSEPSFPVGATRDGTYAGRVTAGGMSVNLNPGTADNNVTFSGSLAEGAYRGKWSHATFAGGKEMGSFTLDPKPARNP